MKVRNIFPQRYEFKYADTERDWGSISTPFRIHRDYVPPLLPGDPLHIYFELPTAVFPISPNAHDTLWVPCHCSQVHSESTRLVSDDDGRPGLLLANFVVQDRHLPFPLDVKMQEFDEVYLCLLFPGATSRAQARERVEKVSVPSLDEPPLTDLSEA